MNGSNDRKQDLAPGDRPLDGPGMALAIRGYLIGLALAAGLSMASFVIPTSGLVWAPAIPVAFIVFAIAQMGVHLVFFLHITTGPDNTNNVPCLGVRGVDRIPPAGRIPMDHGQPRSQHAPHGQGDVDAALKSVP